MGWSWEIDTETAGLSALLAADAAAFLSGVNPSLFTIRTFRSKGTAEAEATKGDILAGIAIGSTLALVAGVGGSAVTESWWPLVATVISLLVLDSAYLWALASPHDLYRSIATQRR